MMLDLAQYDESSRWSRKARSVVTSKLKFLGRRVKWAGSDTLQIQCESGLVADGLLRRGCEVTAIDTREELVSFARTRSMTHGYRIDYRHSVPGKSLPFDRGRFDIVMCDHVFDRNWDLPSLIAEASRVLKPNGVLMYSCVSATLRGRIAADLLPLLFAPGLPGSVRPIRRVRLPVLRETLENMGFTPHRNAGLGVTGMSLAGRLRYGVVDRSAAIWLGSATKA